jgi:peptidoglycan/LPS O-acetylase OafA/YrhL
MERPTMLSVSLGMSIVTAPFIVGLMIGATGDSIFVWTVMGSLPILIGMMAQWMRGRSAVAWWLLSLVVMTLFYAVSAVYLLRMGERTLYSGLGGALLLGAIPLVVIVALLPRLPTPKRSN